MPALTRAADHSKLWFAIAAALLASGRPWAHRGAVRGVAGLAFTSLVTNQVAKRLRHQARPRYLLVPTARRPRRLPTSNSLPSGHAASAAAFAVGAGLENAPLGPQPVGPRCRPGAASRATLMALARARMSVR